MPIYKTNFFFAFHDSGWSETLYQDTTTTQAALNAAVLLIPLRVQCLGGGNPGGNPALTEVRVSDIAVERDSLIYSVPQADQTNHATNDSADNPNLSLLLRLQSGPNFRRQLYMRGQPDSTIQNGLFVRDAVWGNSFDRWSLAVIARPYGILALLRATPVLISAISILPGSEAVINTTAPHGLADQASVRVTKAPGMSGVKGVWFIQVVDATHFTLLGSTASGRYSGGGKYLPRIPSFQAIDGIQVMRAGKRSTGRPFDSPRGRRRARARA